VIHCPQLLADLQTVLRRLEADLLERSEEMAPVKEVLRGEHQRARTAERTAQSYDEWRSDYITQMAAAWVLSCVFVRFLEDNRLIDPPRIAGPSERLARARDEHEIYFRAHPTETDREYLLHVFAELARLPGVKDIIGAHNPIHELPNWLSGDAAGELLRFLQKIDANTGVLVHDFTDSDWNTRFLGDLYQDLSEATRKKYALLQTPEFVEEFILDRTLDPAIEEFGLQEFRMIDPACGSGHFLLGSFTRLLDRWLQKEPSTNVRELVQRVLDSIYGVDINPYAVAIARFRLLLAAMKSCEVGQLTDVPAFYLNLACGDSLLHGTPDGDQISLGLRDYDHVYQSEDLNALRRILRPRHYHAVVANPPYIVPQDKASSRCYRERFSSCYRQYSLSVPFMQKIFQLGCENAYNGQITANSFMTREFGKRLVEDFLPSVDLTHIIDTKWAVIPGHSTPTIILFGRSRPPLHRTIRAVMGIKGDPNSSSDPSADRVWSSIIHQVDQPGSETAFISVLDLKREQLAKHPWSIGGGGASILKEQLDTVGATTLGVFALDFGIASWAGIDEIYIADRETAHRKHWPRTQLRRFVSGDVVRDWSVSVVDYASIPYDRDGKLIGPEIYKGFHRHWWPFRCHLESRILIGGETIKESGAPYFVWARWIQGRYSLPTRILFAFIATHNHFVLDNGGSVFNRHAPVIVLEEDATEQDYLRLLGVLNSSLACFWMKQVCYPKGTTTGDISKEAGRAEANRYEFGVTALSRFPIPNLDRRQWKRIQGLTKILCETSQELVKNEPSSVIADWLEAPQRSLLRDEFVAAQERYAELQRRMIFLQEELDWETYALFEIVDDIGTESNGEFAGPIGISSVERPFLWSDNAVPANLKDELVALYGQRKQVIGKNRNIALVESKMFKRLWLGRQGVYGTAKSTYEERVLDTLRGFLLQRLETNFDFDGRMNDEGEPTAKIDVALISTANLADVVQQDAEFMQVGELYRNDPAFDIHRLVTELVEAESVPLLPVLRFQPSGIRKRIEWERTWNIQREEDVIDTRIKLPKEDPQYLTDLQAQDLKRHQIGDILVPPKYTTDDFASSTYWQLRGKLDVPKERWINFPHCEGPAGMLIIAWAGYDHLQLARAISAYYVDIQERLGGRDDPRLVPLLACLLELLPWLKQWHNNVDPEFGMHMGDYFEGFIQEEARQMGKTLAQIKAWEPPKKMRRRSKAMT
jgi:hypothetical protein